MTAEEEAKQLDSVTDNVQETALDATKVNEALAKAGIGGIGVTDEEFKTVVKTEDVNVIVGELEVTEDEAAAALRAASADDLLVSALRKLVTS